MATGRTVVQLILDDRGFVRKIQGTEKALGRMGSTGRSSTGALALGIGAATVGIGHLTRGISRAIGLTVDLAAATVRLGFDAVRTYESTQLALQATIASQLRFSDDIKENFKEAEGVAQAITDRLIELDRRSAATFQELFAAFQVFTAQGGLKYVKTLEEGLVLTNLLVNSSKIYSKQSNEQLAILTNIRGVLTGNQFQMAEVLQQVAGSGAEWKKQLVDIEKQRNLLDVLKGKLAGVDEASGKILTTWDGILTTGETLRDLFLRRTFENTLDAVKDKSLQVLDTLDKNKDAIGVFLSGISTLGSGGVRVFGQLVVVGGKLAQTFRLTDVAIEGVLFKLSKAKALLIILERLAENPLAAATSVGRAGIFAQALVEAAEFRAELAKTFQDGKAEFDKFAEGILDFDLADFIKQLDGVAGALDKDAEAMAKFIEQTKRQVRPQAELLAKIQALNAANLSQAEIWLALGPAILSAEANYARLGKGLDPVLQRLIRINQEVSKGPLVNQSLSPITFEPRQLSDREQFEKDNQESLGRFDTRGFGSDPNFERIGAPGEELAQQMEIAGARIEAEAFRMHNAFALVAGMGLEMFQTLAQGFRAGGPQAAAALLQVVGQILGRIGAYMIAQGSAEILIGSSPVFPNPAAVIHGKALVAKGTAYGIAGTIAGISGGVISAVAGGPAGSPGNPIHVTQQGSFQQPNIIVPVNSQSVRDPALVQTLDRVNANLSRLSVQGPGVLVQDGVNQLGGISALQTGQDRERSTQENFGESVLRPLNL